MNLFKKVSFLILSLLLYVFLASSAYAATPVSGTWTKLFDKNLRMMAVDPSNANTLYAGTDSCGIYKSTDGGATWNAINNGIPSYGTMCTNTGVAISSIAVNPHNSNIIYSAGTYWGSSGTYFGGAFRSTDGGATWSEMALPNMGTAGSVTDMAMDPNATDTLYVSQYGSFGSVWVTTDQGHTFTRSNLPTFDPHSVVVDPVDSSVYTTTAISFSTPGGVYKSTDAGNSWTNNSPASNYYEDVAVNPNNHNIVYAKAEENGGQLFKSTNAGATWAATQPLPGAVNYTADHSLLTDVVEPDTVYASGNFGDLFRSGDGGATWSNISGLPTDHNGLTYVDGVSMDQNNPDALYAWTGEGLYVYGLQAFHNPPSPTPTPTPLPAQLTDISPAKVWVGLKNSDDVGVKFDLKAEVYANGGLVTTGEKDSVNAGSSGFNNAKVNEISFNSFSPVDFPSGSNLAVKLYVRNACTGSGHNSGTARLWYNDGAAYTQIGSIIINSNSNTYYLVSSAVLSTSVGSGPKQTIDVASGAKCSAFKLFGTWTGTP